MSKINDLQTDRNRFDVVDREQMAAQLVAVMDAHFQRPTAAEKRSILALAQKQITAAEALCRDHE